MRQYLILVLVTFLSASYANASKPIPQVEKGTEIVMIKTAPAINEVVARAEQLFVMNSGGGAVPILSTPEDALTGSNTFLSEAKIDNNYYVHIKFYSSISSADIDPSIGVNNVELTIPKFLINKKIILVPNYMSGDNKISTWQCITDADYSDGVTNGDMSDIFKKYSRTAYTDGCTFVATDNLPAVAE